MFLSSRSPHTSSAIEGSGPAWLGEPKVVVALEVSVNSAYCRRLYSALLGGFAVLGCGHDQGPPPAVTLSLQGQITSAGPNPLPIPGARVELRQWLRIRPEAWTTSDHEGNYRLQSTCNPELSSTQIWIEASATGYWMASSSSYPITGHFSDPPIYCTSEPQVINLSLRAPPTLTIGGQITSSGPNPVPIAGATVRLNTFYNPMTVATTTTDEAGKYEFSFEYPYDSPCGPTDGLNYIIEASAEGYVTATSAAPDPDGPFVSDPPIFCTSEPQVINLYLQPKTPELSRKTWPYWPPSE